MLEILISANFESFGSKLFHHAMLSLGPDLSLKSILANYVTLIFANKTSLSIVKRLNAYINYRWWWSRGDWLPLVWGQISSWLFRACLFLLSYHAVDDVAVSLSENKDSKNSYISPHSQTNQRLYINNTQSMPLSLIPYGYARRKYFFQLANLTALHIEFFLRHTSIFWLTNYSSICIS